MPSALALPSATSGSCLRRNTWICSDYLRDYRSEILSALGQHILITAYAVIAGLVVATLLALLARRLPALRMILLAASTAVYTIPSLALFALLLPAFGLDHAQATVVFALTLYSLTILLRGILSGLDGVPDDVREAARGMGMGSLRLLVRVELPLAVPTVVAALRVTTVSTVALVTVGGIVGNGGLGNLLYAGFNSNFKAQVLVACVLSVVLALLADIGLLGLQRVATPWRRGGQR